MMEMTLMTRKDNPARHPHCINTLSVAEVSGLPSEDYDCLFCL